MLLTEEQQSHVKREYEKQLAIIKAKPEKGLISYHIRAEALQIIWDLHLIAVKEQSKK